jgi:hypothetical protein
MHFAFSSLVDLYSNSSGYAKNKKKSLPYHIRIILLRELVKKAVTVPMEKVIDFYKLSQGLDFTI